MLNEFKGEKNFFRTDFIINREYDCVNQEMFHTLEPSGFPLYRLMLNISSLVIVIRKLGSHIGLCNETRRIVVNTILYVLVCRILQREGLGNIVFISRVIIDVGIEEIGVYLERSNFLLK